MSMLDYNEPITASGIAQYYGKSARWLNKYLEKQGLIYKDDYGQWMPTKYSRENEFTVIICTKINGQKRCFLKWTLKGRLYIHGLLLKDGIIK